MSPTSNLTFVTNVSGLLNDSDWFIGNDVSASANTDAHFSTRIEGEGWGWLASGGGAWS